MKTKMTTLVYVIFLVSLSAQPQSAGSSAGSGLGSMQEAAVRVQGDGEHTVRGIAATIPLDSAQDRFAFVISFFDPGAGAFWWKEYGRSSSSNVSPEAISGFLKGCQLRMAGGHLVSFCTTDMPATLVMRESVLRVKKIDDAWPIVRSELLRRPLPLGDEDDPNAGVHVIQLHKLIDRDFFVPKAYQNSATRPFHPPAIKSIDHNGSRWEITLAGANGRTAVIVLDDGYRVVTTSAPAH